MHLSRNKARVYFSNSKNARIHHLEHPCPDGEHITEGNYVDFETYDEALAEIKRRNKTPVDCKKCIRKLKSKQN